MLILIGLSVTFLNPTLAYHQNDYTILHHRLEVTYVNHEFVHNLKANLVPLNRTTRAINASFDLLITLEKEIIMSFQAYKFLSNEYRLFPFLLNTNYCKMQLDNTFGTLDLKKYSNIGLCPLKAGYYYINKYRPDESKFPPHLVSGDFMLAINISYATVKVANLQWYGTIKKIENLWY